MEHPLRTLLNEIFIKPPRRLYDRACALTRRMVRYATFEVLHTWRSLRRPIPRKPD
jgi:hypothetical protein